MSLKNFIAINPTRTFSDLHGSVPRFLREHSASNVLRTREKAEKGQKRLDSAFDLWLTRRDDSLQIIID
jgi:hypothetical protein